MTAPKPMRPEDVPDELVDLLYDALVVCDGHEEAREVLVAVLPAHEQMVRAEVADDLLSIASEMEQMVNSAVTRHYASRIRVALGEPSTCACFACVPATPTHQREREEPKPTITITVNITPDSPAVQRAIRDVRRRGGA